MLPDTLGPLEEIARKLEEYNKRLSHLERLEFGVGGWTLIEDLELTLVSASFDFQNIPSSFKVLKIIASVRSDKAGTSGVLLGLRFNNDSGNNYDWIQGHVREPNAVSGVDAAAANRISFSATSAVLAPANLFTTHEITIPDYIDTSKHQGLHAIDYHQIGTPSGNIRHGFGGGRWLNTAIISRITIAPDFTDNFVANSRATLWGIN